MSFNIHWMSPVSRCLVARNGTTTNGSHTNHHYLLFHFPHVFGIKKLQMNSLSSLLNKNMLIENETLTNVEIYVLSAASIFSSWIIKKAFREDKMAKVLCCLGFYVLVVFFILLALRGRNRADSYFLFVVFESTSVDNRKCLRRTG